MIRRPLIQGLADPRRAIPAGLVVGQALVIVLDRIVGGPGPFALFGL